MTAGFVEVFYMKRAACLWRGRIDVDASGNVEVPQGPGLGYEPDKASHGAVPRGVIARTPSLRDRYFSCVISSPPARILRGRNVGLLLHVVIRLLLRRLQIVDALLQELASTLFRVSIWRLAASSFC